MAADVGTGTTLSFSGFTYNVLSASWSMSRASIDTSHMGTTTARTFMPGDLYDAGEVTFEVQFDPTIDPPVAGAAATLTVVWAGLANTSWAASAVLTSFDASGSLEELMTATATFKLTGSITFDVDSGS